MANKRHKVKQLATAGDMLEWPNSQIPPQPGRPATPCATGVGRPQLLSISVRLSRVVKFEPNGENDLLHLRFANHEVQITGKRLRELGLAFQKLAVDWVKTVPERYAAVADSDSVCITAIKVSELQALQ